LKENKSTKELLTEALAKHRHVKRELLMLIEKCEGPTITKDRIKELLFNLYKEIK